MEYTKPATPDSSSILQDIQNIVGTQKRIMVSSTKIQVDESNLTAQQKADLDAYLQTQSYSKAA